MISLFRKFRKTVLAENRITRYFFYAIGEIILVVLGILIALSINTWNDTRKQRLLEGEYYCRLLEDAIQDKEQIAELTAQANIRLKAANQALRFLQGTQPAKADVGSQIKQSISAIYIEFKPSDAAFEDLKSGANLNIITDKNIIRALNTYYNKLEGLVSIIQVNGQKAVDVYYSRQNNFENGWIEANMASDSFKNGIDQDVYANIPVDNSGIISEGNRTQLYIDALYYVAANTRQIELYALMKKENDALTATLKTKCSG